MKRMSTNRKQKNPPKLQLFALLLALLLAFSAGAQPSARAETASIIPDDSVPAIPRYDPSASGAQGWVRANGELFYLHDGYALTGLQLIDGQYCYFDAYGVKTAAVGVDVSTYNENIDWERVKAQGVDFAIIRVGGRGWTSGKLYGDLRCEGYLRGARRAGLRIGAYFYSTATCEAEAVEEADAALRVLRGRALDFPIFYDVEFSGEYPEGRADRLSAGQRTKNALAFCRRIESAGYRAGVYSGRYFYLASLNRQALSARCLWMANYTRDGLPPDGAREYRLWQFSDRKSVAGICCGVDMNVLFTEFPQ